MTELIDIQALRDRFLNVDFDVQEFHVTAEQCLEFALASGELAPRFTDPAHPDFQAPPTLPSSFRPGRRLPEGFPKLPGLSLNASKVVVPKQPIRPDVLVIGRTHLRDIYAKTGRSGRMTFVVTRMEIYDPDGVQLATTDSRTVIRERPGP